MSTNACFITNITSGAKSASMEDQYCVLSDTLVILDDQSRYIFMGIFIVFSVMSLLGNCAVVYSIRKRKYRFVQKTCIISLAVSDLLSTVVIALNQLETFAQSVMVWTLGSFLCSFIPMCQMAGITASSTALMFIAMDRYRNVVHALSKRWNPSPVVCLVATAAIWLIIMGVCYPLYDFFVEVPVTLIYLRNISFDLIDFDVGAGDLYDFVDADICISFEKESIMVYYVIMVIIIFLPLLIVFLWFYYSIAALVWKHRKPVSSVFNKNESSAENSTSNSEIRIRNVKNTVGKNRDIRVERKIRTFKIIITLMVVFIICRLPYFTVYILKLSLTEDYGMWLWYLNYAFLALHLVNCCLNPLLYTFLNPTLTIWIKARKVLKDFTWEICCFCFSKGEFDEYEKENPFADGYNRSGRDSKVKFEENVQEIVAKY